MEVREITYQDANPFIKRWHYSGDIPAGLNVFFGYFINNQLYAVANYGHGVNCHQASFLKKLLNIEDIIMDNLYELKRLCRIEPKNEIYPLTKFLSKCHKLLKKKGIKYIVSFSDPLYKHNGGIYKAANFEYLGKTKKARCYVNKNGEVFHQRYPYNYAKRHNITMTQAINSLRLKEGKTPEKDRWFIRLCSNPVKFVK